MWLSTIGVRGKACAASAASRRCQNGTRKSHESPYFLSRALVGAIPLGLAMRSRQHIVAARVTRIVLRQVIAPPRRIIAQEEFFLFARTQPGMPVLPQIPKMMMRIDQGYGIGLDVPAAVDRSHD